MLLFRVRVVVESSHLKLQNHILEKNSYQLQKIVRKSDFRRKQLLVAKIVTKPYFRKKIITKNSYKIRFQKKIVTGCKKQLENHISEKKIVTSYKKQLQNHILEENSCSLQKIVRKPYFRKKIVITYKKQLQNHILEENSYSLQKIVTKPYFRKKIVSSYKTIFQKKKLLVTKNSYKTVFQKKNSYQLQKTVTKPYFRKKNSYQLQKIATKLYFRKKIVTRGISKYASPKEIAAKLDMLVKLVACNGTQYIIPKKKKKKKKLLNIRDKFRFNACCVNEVCRSLFGFQFSTFTFNLEKLKKDLKYLASSVSRSSIDLIVRLQFVKYNSCRSRKS